MPRNSPNILPYCQYCGQYKGLGPCRNAECKVGTVQDVSPRVQGKRCIICGETALIGCSRCGKSYCSTHSRNVSETSLWSLNQHLGTCVICGEVVCEHCWIFNKKGQITCQIHYSDSRHDE